MLLFTTQNLGHAEGTLDNMSCTSKKVFWFSSMKDSHALKRRLGCDLDNSIVQAIHIQISLNKKIYIQDFFVIGVLVIHLEM